jgi:phosphopantothenoylcysteine decarboxylase/phosphopantothenate--cysteine ligase
MSLRGKKIILAITGSIAAYKTPQLVRLLVAAGAEVQVLMTGAAADFVSPLALATVSQKEVFSSVSNGSQWNNHVHLGRWADIMLIAPCSANTLARMASGLCDNMVQAVYLSAACPVVVAPAMDEDMWLHASTRRNIETIRSFGNEVIPVGHGELASGLIGAGRMAEPAEIVNYVDDLLTAREDTTYAGKNVLITAGPTYEALDPVRFIGNHSTGKMGVALAETFAARGARVHLVLGPGSAQTNRPGIEVHHVVSAREMLEVCEGLFAECSVAVMAAAVADFRPEQIAGQKIKKGAEDKMQLTLVKNPDILATLGRRKRADQVVVGFALETEHEVEHARKKLETKNADLIVLNSLAVAGAGFGHDTNKVTLVFKDGSLRETELLSKTEIAKSIVDCIRGINDEHA